MRGAAWLMDVLRAWLTAFAITQAVEAPIYGVALRGRRPGPRLFLALGASALTHPIVWLVVLAFGQRDYWLALAAAEAFAVAAEAGYLRVLGVPGAPLWALAANTASLGLGLGAWMIGAW
jgi:hypothetical protein